VFFGVEKGKSIGSLRWNRSTATWNYECKFVLAKNELRMWWILMMPEHTGLWTVETLSLHKKSINSFLVSGSPPTAWGGMKVSTLKVARQWNDFLESNIHGQPKRLANANCAQTRRTKVAIARKKNFLSHAWSSRAIERWRKAKSHDNSLWKSINDHLLRLMSITVKTTASSQADYATSRLFSPRRVSQFTIRNESAAARRVLLSLAADDLRLLMFSISLLPELESIQLEH
jgi:hypothetical protein